MSLICSHSGGSLLVVSTPGAPDIPYTQIADYTCRADGQAAAASASAPLLNG